ncbi:hypothetical protein VTN00DRAFT_345 [Thermoascus crustaceus]|uniref:uncharacterized protein n=1 Tax=Thermoascus crustaceus TaxID=5088 RepID=UPI003743FBD9
MGFFNFFVTVVVEFLPFTWKGSGFLQQPLPLDVPSTGVVFDPQEITVDVHHQEPKEQFVCQYPKLTGWELCNGPNSRDCWLRDTNKRQPIFSQFDIQTDYEDVWPPGITRKYWLEVDYKTISPDGIPKLAQVINKTLPGPLIEACWGDDIVVHVTDKLPDNGTTIHWHGIRQLHTNDADGVNGVTQCPIAENNTYTYRFKATQYGHSWYHSHYSLQYPNGVAGPLLIHGPTSADWDIEWEPIFLQDWYHHNAFQYFVHELYPNTTGGLPKSDSILVGGQGRFNNSGSVTGSIFTKVVQPGKKILLHLINASTDLHYIFSIDGHQLKVISTDFVPIEPYVTNSLSIGIGQRYSVILETNQTTGNHWIRTEPTTDNCNQTTTQIYETGILRYQGAPNQDPTSTKNPGVPSKCVDEPAESLKPIVRWEVGSYPANDVDKSTFEVGQEYSRKAQRWTIGAKPLWLNFSDPTLLSLGNRTFNPDYDVYEYDYVNEWIYIVIIGNNKTIDLPDVNVVTAAHPIHLHGHDFAILGTGPNKYDELRDPLTFNYHNPPRRDVALLPSGGWLAIAFRSDNPGVWLLHCHIAWHASSGLALQILERRKEILDDLGPQRVAAVERTCAGWDQWLKGGELIDQEDSGI